MPDIRELERADLPAVAGLLGANLQVWSGDADSLAATFFDHPWADQELPSFVAVDDVGEVFGFIGAQARRLQFDDRTLRGVCCTQLVVAPDHRQGAAGALLIGRLLSGPQDLTWSDSATDLVARIWRLYGGHLDHARACDWVLVARPERWLRSLIAATVRRRTVRRDLAPVGALPFHAVGPRVARRAFPKPSADVVGEGASTQAVIEHRAEIANGLRVAVDHDERHLEHLFGLVEATDGPVIRRLVRRSGRPIGWYAYLPRRGGVSRVLHLAASEHNSGAVLGELVDHARAGGSAVVAGRAEPHLMRSLGGRFAVLGLARTPIFHTKDPQLAAALATSSSLLTRLDGEVLIT